MKDGDNDDREELGEEQDTIFTDKIFSHVRGELFTSSDGSEIPVIL